MRDLNGLSRKAAKMRAHIYAGGPEAEVAKGLLSALLEAHPDLEIEEPPPVVVRVGVLRTKWDQAIFLTVAEHLDGWGIETVVSGRTWAYRGPKWLGRFALDLYRKNLAVLHDRFDLVTGAMMHASFPEAAKRMASRADKKRRLLSFEELALVDAARCGLHRAPTPARQLPAPGAEE